jgi:hypothetical protein
MELILCLLYFSDYIFYPEVHINIFPLIQAERLWEFRTILLLTITQMNAVENIKKAQEIVCSGHVRHALLRLP